MHVSLPFRASTFWSMWGAWWGVLEGKQAGSKTKMEEEGVGVASSPL